MDKLPGEIHAFPVSILIVFIHYNLLLVNFQVLIFILSVIMNIYYSSQNSKAFHL